MREPYATRLALITVGAISLLGAVLVCGGILMRAKRPTATLPAPQPAAAPVAVSGTATTTPRIETPAYPRALTGFDIAVEVTPVSAVIAKPSFPDVYGEAMTGEREQLVFTVRVTNRSQSEIDFEGWKQGVGVAGWIEDEHGTDYRTFNPYPSEWKIAGNEAPLALAPGESAQAVILFEKPIDAAESITVHLDGGSVGDWRGGFQWKLVRSDWTSQDPTQEKQVTTDVTENTDKD